MKQETPRSEDTLPHEHRDKERRFGRNIAYGIQQTITCFLTDFIDPIVGKWFQTKVGNKEHEVTHQQVWGGEVAGDLSAFGIYMIMKQGLTKQVDAVTGWVKSFADASLTKAGKLSLKPWAKAHYVSEDSKEYQKKLEAYKNFQAENMVDSSIIATGATAMNVVVQRGLGNKQALATILGGKLIGTFTTLTAMLGLRAAAPETMNTLDNEIEQKYVTPPTRWIKKVLHVREDAGERYDNLPAADLNSVAAVAPNHATRLSVAAS